MKKNILILAALALLAGITLLNKYIPRVNVSQNQIENTSSVPSKDPVEIANPASQLCISYGYTISREKDQFESERGYCIFPDGTRCDEWEFFRGECGAQWKSKASDTASSSEKFFDRYRGCPEWVNCMPSLDANPRCDVPPQCEGYAQRVY